MIIFKVKSFSTMFNKDKGELNSCLQYENSETDECVPETIFQYVRT